MTALLKPHFTVDIEATNRCNAKCYFCPRELTPRQGLMSDEVFEQTLVRVSELRDQLKSNLDEVLQVTFCGLGEALLNPRTPDYVRSVRDEGLHCALSTNGSLLNEARAEALLDAGISRVDINVGEEGEAYEKIYGLSFAKVEANVLRFAQMAKDRCVVSIVLVNHAGDKERVEYMRSYWRERGFNSFIDFEIINRGGSIEVDHMQYDEERDRAEALELLARTGSDPVCGTPFVFMFVGWDGNYYLCSSDWQKEVPLGSVFDVTFSEVLTGKLETVQRRDKVCSTCTRDPVNRVIDALRAVRRGEAEDTAADALVKQLAATSDGIRSVVRSLGFEAEPRTADDVLARGAEFVPRPRGASLT